MNLNDLAQWLGYSCSNDTLVTGFCIDSRQIKPGDLFVALQGQHCDGHAFIRDAEEKGAVAVLCCRADPQAHLIQWVVPDVVQAFALLAARYRQTITCPIIALTGSNGKTSVKEMIASILPKPAHATVGNLNNHLGVPLSLLQLRSEHRYAVFELGASQKGDIAHTVALVQPEVALINNIAPAHIAGFGSLDKVAEEKGEIYQGVVDGGTVVVNEDDDYAHFWDKKFVGKKELRFSLTKSVDVYTRKLSFDEQGLAHFELVCPAGAAPVRLQVPGEHTVRNALAAAACCFVVGITLTDIVQGLERFQGVAGRMTFLRGKNQALIIDDTYNANLRSVLTAVDVLSKRSGRRILVLGDMGGLGEWAQQHHEEVGYAACRHGIDLLMTCGTHSEFTAKAFGATGKHYKNQDELARDLLDELDFNTVVLVKGSRASAMEKVVHQLL